MTVVIPILNPAVGRCVDGRSSGRNPTRRSVCPKKIVFRSHDRLCQWLGNLFQRHPFVFQLDGLAIPHLFVDADEHQRSVVNRYELICHHSQQTRNKQEQQQVPASYQYFFQYAHRFLSFRTANLRIYFQYCSICSSVLPFVSGTNFQINRAARTPMTP